MPHNVKMLYSTFVNKKKERFDIILEPLQAITQLALIAFCPIGTKIAIQNNLLEIQYPGMSQSLVRWYNNDNKEDLFYLFNACRRFTMFYGFLSDIQVQDISHYDEDNINNMTDIDDDKNTIISHNNTTTQYPLDLYNLLIFCAKEGLNKLSQTYGDVNKVSLLHTLQMYKVILDNPMFFDHTNQYQNSQNNQFPPHLNLDNGQNQKQKQNEETQTQEQQNHNKGNNKQTKHKINKTQNHNRQYPHPHSQSSTPNKSPLFMGQQSPQNHNQTPENNIDSIFINIRHLYTINEYNIILYTFKMLENCEEADTLRYVDGLNIIMKTTYIKIKKWINDNIVF